MSKMGRPPADIDWDTFKNLCKIQCTLKEISAVFEIDSRTIERRVKKKFKCTFAELKDMWSEAGKASLRRLQFRAAENGNASLLMFLGKQYLGQTDVQHVRQQTLLSIQDKNEVIEMVMQAKQEKFEMLEESKEDNDDG